MIRPELTFFGTLAMIPAMIGPLEAEARTLVAPLCNGASIAIPVSPGEVPPGPQQGPCCAKGCKGDKDRTRARGKAKLRG